MSSYKLTQIFQFYDGNSSESIDVSELTVLLKDLFILRDGSIPEDILEICGYILSAFDLSGDISLDNFISAAKKIPSPFDHPSTQGGLLQTLISPNFSPTYEEKVIPPWEEKLWSSRPFVSGLWMRVFSTSDPSKTPRSSGLHERSRRVVSCRINDPLQVSFRIPKLENRTFNVKLQKSSTLQQVYEQICSEWPGRQGRGFVKPNATNIQICLDGEPLVYRQNRTVENTGFYFMAFNRDAELTIDFSIPNNTTPSAPPPPSPESTSRGGERKEVPLVAPIPPSPSGSGLSPPSGTTTYHGSAQFDALSTKILQLTHEREEEVHRIVDRLRSSGDTVHSLQERILDIADSIPDSDGSMDEVDRRGLKDMKNEERQKLHKASEAVEAAVAAFLSTAL